MSIARFNKGKIFDVTLEGKETVKLADLPLETFVIDAIMFTEKGKFGKSAFIVSGDMLIYLPKHKVRECEEIVSDAAIVQDIKDGRCGFEVETYSDETGSTRYSVRWVEL